MARRSKSRVTIATTGTGRPSGWERSLMHFCLLQPSIESPSLRYLKQYIAVSSGSYNRMWLHKRTSPKALLNLKISPLLQDEGTALLDLAGIGYLKKPESFRVTVDRKAIESHAETFDKVIALVKRK